MLLSNWYAPFNNPCDYFMSQLKTQDDIASFIAKSIENNEMHKFISISKYFESVYEHVFENDPVVIHFKMISTIMGLGNHIKTICSTTDTSSVIMRAYNSLIYDFYHHGILCGYFIDFNYSATNSKYDFLVWLDPISSLRLIFNKSEYSHPEIMTDPDHYNRINNSLRSMIGILLDEHTCFPTYVKDKCLTEITVDLLNKFAFRDNSHDFVYQQSTSPTTIHAMNLLLNLNSNNLELNEFIETITFQHKVDYVHTRLEKLGRRYDYLRANVIFYDLIDILKSYKSNESMIVKLVQYYSELPIGFSLPAFKSVISIIVDQFFAIKSDPYYNEQYSYYYNVSLCYDVANTIKKCNITPNTPLEVWRNNHGDPEDKLLDSINNGEPAMVTEAIEFLDSIQFIDIDDSELIISNEATGDQSDRRRETSEKLSKAQAKVHRAFRNYKDEEDKIDSQLTKIVSGTAAKLTDLDTDKIRDEVVEGKKFSVIGVLKKVLASVAIFSTSKVAALILLVTHFALKKKVTNAEKKRICLELSAEIEMVNEKIDDAKSEGDRDAKYELMRTKHNLENALAKIRSSYKGDTAESIAAAKSVISSNK